MTSYPDGMEIETAEYLPFGLSRKQTGTEVTYYKFTDQELDAETGLYNYDARLYDPAVGGFISADSVVPDLYNPQSLNRYAYCLGNPLRYTDPTGHWDEEGNSSGGFGGHGIGNPGSYGGNSSVGEPGFSDGYASGYDDKDSSIRNSRTRSHVQRAEYDMRNVEPSKVFDVLGGSGSYFRGLYRLGRWSLRQSGVLGDEERLRAELEGWIERRLVKELRTNPKLKKLAWDMAKKYVSNNKARVAGRLATGGVVSIGLTRVAGYAGTATGYTLGGLAAQGDAIYGIEYGLDSIESYVTQFIGGDF